MMLVLERYIPTFAMALERVGPQARLTSLAQAAPQNIVALVGPPGLSAADSIANPDDILDFIASFDGSLN